MIWKLSSTDLTRVSGRRKLHHWFIYRVVCTLSNFSTDQAIVSRIVRHEQSYSIRWFDSMLGALQFLGNLFEYFLVRRNKGKKGKGGLKAILQLLSSREALVLYITISRQICFDGCWSNERRCKPLSQTKDYRKHIEFHRLDLQRFTVSVVKRMCQYLSCIRKAASAPARKTRWPLSWMRISITWRSMAHSTTVK